MASPIYINYYEAPFGKMILGEREGRICVCDHATDDARVRFTYYRLQKLLKTEYEERNTEGLTTAMRQLDEYFSGWRKLFDLPLLMIGTDFQKTVWRALKAVEYGRTASYKAVAEAIGRPESVRAVAGAIGANPMSIIIPCHRIVGSDGSLTGYAGGLDAKRYLLELEKARG